MRPLPSPTPGEWRTRRAARDLRSQLMFGLNHTAVRSCFLEATRARRFSPHHQHPPQRAQASRRPGSATQLPARPASQTTTIPPSFPPSNQNIRALLSAAHPRPPLLSLSTPTPLTSAPHHHFPAQSASSKRATRSGSPPIPKHLSLVPLHSSASARRLSGPCLPAMSFCQPQRRARRLHL